MSLAKIAIVIPARYNSKRLPGKPLAQIAGKSMLERVHDIAMVAASHYANTHVIIATDDKRIINHTNTFNATAVMTPKDCVSGSNRVRHALDAKRLQPDVIINLQGDEPLLPPVFIKELIDAMLSDTSIEVVTPITQLSWQQLDKLREHKHHNPFSGTTAIIDSQDDALWFSKKIIPAIRNEEQLRQRLPLSPVYRHIGLYGYQYQSLKHFDERPESTYESLEGLEQLRFLEAGVNIKAVKVSYGSWPAMSGVDTLDDLKIAENLLSTHGELVSA